MINDSGVDAWWQYSPFSGILYTFCMLLHDDNAIHSDEYILHDEKDFVRWQTKYKCIFSWDFPWWQTESIWTQMTIHWPIDITCWKIEIIQTDFKCSAQQESANHRELLRKTAGIHWQLWYVQLPVYYITRSNQWTIIGMQPMQAGM